jgi:integrase
VLELAKDQEFKEWLLVMLETGARVEEMLRIEARHLQKENRVLLFPAKESKGRRKIRVIHLPDQSFEIISRLAGEHPEGKLFLNTEGRPWNKDSINCRFKPMKVKLGIPKLTATALRHSYAYDKLDRGVDSAHVAELMGHSDTRMLMTRYGHLSKNHRLLSAAANRTGFQNQQPKQEPPSKAAG